MKNKYFCCFLSTTSKAFSTSLFPPTDGKGSRGHVPFQGSDGSSVAGLAVEAVLCVWGRNIHQADLLTCWRWSIVRGLSASETYPRRNFTRTTKGSPLRMEAWFCGFCPTSGNDIVKVLFLQFLPSFCPTAGTINQTERVAAGFY